MVRSWVGLGLILAALSAPVGADPEEAVEQLDHRVTELERVKFFGSLDSVVITQSFRNRGLARVLSPSFPARNGLSYADAVGTAVGANFCYFSPATPPVNGVLDLETGIPMTGGSAVVNVLRLGLEGNLTDEIFMRLTLAAVQAQGDALVASWWGPPLPYLTDVFTSTPVAGLTHPRTNAVLEQLRMEYQQHQFELGAIRSRLASPLLFSQQQSPRFLLRGGLDSFGARLFGDQDRARYELLVTHLPDGIG
ncbi:MAG: hypothetical protein AB1758_09995, partial [Candidatus Eremiobacterota bacterium]